MLVHSRARPVTEVTRAEDVEAILQKLQSACGDWHAMPRKQKIGLLQQVRRRAVKASVQIGKACAKVTLHEHSHMCCALRGSEWVCVATVL